MLEILFLISFTKKIGKIVEQKGYSSGRYKFLTCVLWFGGEIIGVIIGSFLTIGFAVYIIAIIGAAFGAGISYLIADGLSPVNEIISEVDITREGHSQQEVNQTSPFILKDICDDCKYFKKTGIVDRFKGVCGLSKEVTYSSFYCSSNKFVKKEVLT